MRENGKRLLSVIALLAGLAAVASAAMHVTGALRTAEPSPAAEVEITSHYCFIAENIADPFWESLYREMRTEGLQNGAYIECLNLDFPTDYQKEDFMRIAVSLDADGIFVEGDASETLQAEIDAAVEAGIPVITLMTDAPMSLRDSFVEIGNYNLGREYARQILRDGQAPPQTVLVIVDEDIGRSSLSNMISGMMEYFTQEGVPLPDVQTEAVGNDAFNSAQIVRRRILTVDRVPDVILCLNEQDTLNAYQVLVDHNMLSRVRLLGSGASPTLLDAVGRGTISALLITDPAETAARCVRAMNERRDNDYVSDYIALDVLVIDQDNVTAYRQETEAEGT